MRRTARVHVPASTGPRDLVVALHGLHGTSAIMEKATGLTPMSDELGFVVAYPQGTGKGRQTSWNAGKCCEAAAEADVPDVAFLDALVAELDKRACARGKVVAAGFSNGSAMVQRWACESDAVDAVVAASSPLMYDGPCRRRQVEIHYFHGADDTIVPVDGRSIDDVTAPPMRAAFKRWVRLNRCKGKPREVREGGETCEVWSGAAPTSLCVIDGWKHRWPSQASTEIRRILTRSRRR